MLETDVEQNGRKLELVYFGKLRCVLAKAWAMNRN
jgi:hypothetical protein